MTKAATKDDSSNELDEDRVFETVRKLFEKANCMLDWPLEKTVLTVGTGLTISIEPAGWGKTDALTLIETAKELQTFVNDGSLRPKAKPKATTKKPGTTKRPSKKASS